MIHKLHRHLHSKTHVPTLGFFSVVAGLIAIVGVLAVEFTVPKNSEHIVSAQVLSTTSCIPAGSVNTSSSTSTLVTEQPVSVTQPLSGTQTFHAYFDGTTLNSNLLNQSLNCVELQINQVSSGTQPRNYYVYFTSVRSLLPSGLNRYDIVLPYDTNQLENNTSTGYFFDVRLYIPISSSSYQAHYSPTTSAAFTVSNGVSAATPYTITEPTSNPYNTSTAFSMKVAKPADAGSQPVIIFAHAQSSTPTTPQLPWSIVPSTGSAINPSVYQFSIPFASAGNYLYRACPDGVSGSLNISDPAPRCSTTLLVNYATTPAPNTTPGPPTANAASAIGAFSFTANWVATSEATSYRLDVAMNTAFSTFVSGYQNISATSNSLMVTGLTPATSYYYRVRATKAVDVYSNNSNVISVMTTTTANQNTNTAINQNTNISGNQNSSTPPALDTGAPISPNVVAPAVGAVLNELNLISGSTEPGLRIKVNLFRKDGTASTLVLMNENIYASTTNGTFIYGLSPLRPAAYHLTVLSFKNNTWSTPTERDFTIKPVTLTLSTNTATPLKGVVILDVLANRSDVSKMEFYRQSTSATAPEFFLGGATSPISGAPTKWSFSFNSLNQPNGTYRFYVKAQVAGVTAVSGSLSLEIQNATVNPSTPTVTVPLDTPSTTAAPAPVTNTNSTAPTTLPNTPSVPVTTTQTIAEETTTTSEPVLVTNFEQQPKADPRQTGQVQPETLVVQAVTTIESNTNQPSGLKLSGVGPPNTFVTVYIFSSPVIITTLTDGNGNWTYTLDRPLENGSHEVYVTLTDETGTVEQKSNPLAFFVAEARAVSPQDFQRYQSQQAKLDDSYTVYYLVMAGILVVLTIVIFLYVRLRRDHQLLSGSQ